MLIAKRNTQIRELRNKKKTLKFIAEKFNISSERVRQICGEKIEKKELYRKIEDSYRNKLISKTDYSFLRAEIKELSKHDRTKATVIRRRSLIVHLHDKLGFSFFQIATILNRHHSSITNLYYNNFV